MNVAIVGGGPAGSVLALLLARAGVEVTLLERAAFPRPKPCGDCVSAGATRILDRLGLLDAVEQAGPAHLDGWRVFAARGDAFSARFDELGAAAGRSRALALSRDRLDAVLLAAAGDAGADVRTRTTVIDVARGRAPQLRIRSPAGTGSLRTDLVVGADGLRSTVVRRLGLVRRRPRVRKVSLTAHIELARDGDAFGEMHLAPDLCAGLAPVGVDTYNLTLVADARRFGRAIAADTLGFFLTALQRFPALPARLAGARLAGAPLSRAGAPPARPVVLLASGPFDVPVRRIAGTGWVLAGDAAGYFDPFTGQGIGHAMRDAELLARAILDRPGGVHRPDAFARYVRDHRRLTLPARRLQHLIDAVLRHPAVADRAIARLSRAPAAAHALLAATADLAPPSGLLSPAALLSFALPQPRSVE